MNFGFDNTPEGFAFFVEWRIGFGDASPTICMEATSAYSIPLAEHWVEQGFCVNVVNPAKIAAFAKSELSRATTDKADAKLIARYGSVMQPPAWTPQPQEIRELQALLRRVEHLLAMERMEQNCLNTATPPLPTRSGPYSSPWSRNLRIPATTSVAMSAVTPA